MLPHGCYRHREVIKLQSEAECDNNRLVIFKSTPVAIMFVF